MEREGLAMPDDITAGETEAPLDCICGAKWFIDQNIYGDYWKIDHAIGCPIWRHSEIHSLNEKVNWDELFRALLASRSAQDEVVRLREGIAAIHEELDAVNDSLIGCWNKPKRDTMDFMATFQSLNSLLCKLTSLLPKGGA